MAIGKVNAYATIQAPNVDFGEVALNAQKFQEADLERQKELKLAQLKAEKPKPFVFKPEVLKEDSGLDFFNISQRQTVADTMQEYYDLSLKNEKGELGAEGGAKLYALQQNIQNADQALKSVGGHFKEYIKGVKDHSGAFKENENYIQGFTANNGQNVIRTNDSNGNPYFQQVEIDDTTKKTKVGEDGKPIIKKFIDKYGVERDGWGYADILSGKAFEPLNAFDDQKFATDVAKLVSPYKTGSDTGITKIVRETLTPSNITTINTMIETQVLNNREHLADVLYKLDPVKYKNPKADYTKEDREFAKLGMEKSIYGGIGLSSVKDVNLDQLNKENDRKNKYTFVPTEDVVKLGEINMTPGGKVNTFNKMPDTLAKVSYGLGDNVRFKQLGTSKTGLVAGYIVNLSYDKASGKVLMGLKTLDVKGIRYSAKNGNQISWERAKMNPEELTEESKNQFDLDMSGYGRADSYKYDVRQVGAEGRPIIAGAMGKPWNQIQSELIEANKKEIQEYKSNKKKAPKKGVLD